MADGRDQEPNQPPVAERTNEPSGNTGFEREPSNAFNVISSSVSNLVDDDDLAEEDRTFDPPLVPDDAILPTGERELRDEDSTPTSPALRPYSAPRIAVQAEPEQASPKASPLVDQTDTLPGPRLVSTRSGGSAAMSTPGMWDDAVTRASVAILAFILFFAGIGSFGLWDPWEVHYGAVGWGFMERQDWISPWWGSYWTMPGGSMEGSYFFSKPVLLLWMMGIGMEVFGFNPTGIRVGVALIAFLGVMSVYMMGLRVFSKRVGILMALTLATSPFYAMLGRQAQADMPFVGPMTIALSFFIMGVFGKDRNERADRTLWSIFWGFVLLITVPQLHTITVGQMRWQATITESMTGSQRLAEYVEAFFLYGPSQLGIYLLLMLIVAVTTYRSAHKTRGQVYLFTFYVFVGLATMGKGMLGFAVPGAIIALYLAVSREWRMLPRLEIPRGILIAIFVGFPWYGAMFARHGGIGGAYWTRFIIHDHFKRLASGVHQTDTGSFEHFIKWLAYGLFPWGSFVPAIIARAINGDTSNARSDQDRARLFIFLWFVVAFTLFTMSSTKFHHYIFPAVPAVALLAALTIDDAIEGRIKWSTWWPIYVAGGAIFTLVAFDLVTEPQHLKNMFTYKYDRTWDHSTWDPGLTLGLRCLTAISALGFLMMCMPQRKKLFRAGLGVTGTGAALFVLWALNVYMPAISSTWSQHGIWETYQAHCTHIEPPPGAHRIKQERYCEESAIAYKLNWRGETYFTMNEVIPVSDNEEWNYFIEANDSRCFYAIMERSSISGFRNAVPADQRSTVEVVPIVNPDGTSEEERQAYEQLRGPRSLTRAAATRARQEAEQALLEGPGFEGSAEGSAEGSGEGSSEGSAGATPALDQEEAPAERINPEDMPQGWGFWERLLHPGYQGDDSIKFALVRVNCQSDELDDDEQADGEDEAAE